MGDTHGDDHEERVNPQEEIVAAFPVGQEPYKYTDQHLYVHRQGKEKCEPVAEIIPIPRPEIRHQRQADGTKCRNEDNVSPNTVNCYQPLHVVSKRWGVHELGALIPTLIVRLWAPGSNTPKRVFMRQKRGLPGM